MATKARQQYFADETSLQKDSREFSIADDIQQKIDSVETWAQVNKIDTIKVNWTAIVPDSAKAVNIDVPDVIDNLYTISSDDALSAKQWKVLYDYIQNVSSRWRFLSNWNSATGLPITNPSESPYVYRTWDYYIVSNIAGLWWTNYRPDGSLYIIWQASTVAETESVDVSDFYFYDWTTWLLLKNSARSWAVDSSLSTTSTNPVENRVVTNAINDKANIVDVLTKTNTTVYTPTANYHPATKKYVDDNSVAFKPFPAAFDTTHTTQDFLDSIEAEYLPVGSAYLGQVSLSDMPSGVTVQWDVEVYVYPQNIIYAVMRSTDISPYEWIVNSQYNRWWEPTNTDTTYTAWANIQISNQHVISATDTTYVASDFDIKDLADSTSLRSTWSWKQDALTLPATPTQWHLVTWWADNKTLSDWWAIPTGVPSWWTDWQVLSKVSWNIAWANAPVTSVNTQTWAVTLDADDISDSTTTNKFVTATDKSTWSGKQDALVSWTNIKTVNSNSLLWSWDLTLNDVKVSATAPSSPTEWMVWYDTTNDQLKVYDWTNWNVTWKEYNAWEWIEIRNWDDYSAMRWPCEEWFHIPLQNEWQKVFDDWVSLGLRASDNWVGLETYLKLPQAWQIEADASHTAGVGMYRSSQADNSISYMLRFFDTYASPANHTSRSVAKSIRPFADTPVVPNNEWTVLYQWIWDAGIYHNSTLWIISISSDWTTWTTIADKNLWATTVYNNWDALSQNNCGNFYQRWNNYGFAFTWPTTTSSVKVDASNYWPRNYYSSSTFITTGLGEDWSSVRNDNLWGGETWVVTFDNAITNTGVLSVNWQTGDVTISWWISLAPTSLQIKYHWYGTQTDYEWLSQYYTDTPWDTAYFTI